MKGLVLMVNHVNWGEIGPGVWKEIQYKIYKDLKVEIIASYNEEENKLYYTSLTKKDYEEILKNMELAKNNDMKIDACDGDAWEFIQYSDGQEFWKRDTAYIYGIEPLKNITTILNKLIKNN